MDTMCSSSISDLSPIMEENDSLLWGCPEETVLPDTGNAVEVSNVEGTTTAEDLDPNAILHEFLQPSPGIFQEKEVVVEEMPEFVTAGRDYSCCL